MRKIPSLDLRTYRHGSRAERADFSAVLRAGLSELGFVTLEGHGVDPALVGSVYRHFERFFARSEPEKLECSGVAGGQRGFTPFGVEHAKGQSRADLKEFFHVGQPHPGEPFGEPAPTPALGAEISRYAPNVWPSGSGDLQADCLRMFRALEGTAIELLHALAEGFDLPRESFAEMLCGGNSILRALHYPPVSPDVPAGALRAAPHEDINLITLLCEASDAGLEILPPRSVPESAAWIPVEVLPGQIVVDSGDMLTRVTNGVIPATTHRVVNPQGSRNGDRYALPFFAHPRPSSDLSVMDHFVTRDRPRAWPPITAAEFLRERLREIGLLEGPELTSGEREPRDAPAAGA